MTSQPVYQTVTIHKLFNISRSKDNQPTKFGQVMEIFLFKNHAENEKLQTSFCFLNKLYNNEVGASGLELSFNDSKPSI